MEIVISALVATGDKLLFELVTAEDGSPHLALPRCPFPADAEAIEDALADFLRDQLSIEVLQQEFVETLYEPVPGSTLPLLNNLQLVSQWSGTVPEHTVTGVGLTWVPVAALPELNVPAEMCAALLAAFGLGEEAQAQEDSGAMRGLASLLAGIDAETPAQEEPAVGRVIVLTGPAGAGKSTVAQALAKRLARCAVVSLDDLRHLAVSGAPTPHWLGGDPAASHAFGTISLLNGAALARNFAAAGFDCIVEGVLETAADSDALWTPLGEIDTFLVTLLPDLPVLLARDQGRPADQQMGERSRELFMIFTSGDDRRGVRINTSGQTPDETAAVILARLEEARICWSVTAC